MLLLLCVDNSCHLAEPCKNVTSHSASAFKSVTQILSSRLFSHVVLWICGDGGKAVARLGDEGNKPTSVFERSFRTDLNLKLSVLLPNLLLMSSVVTGHLVNLQPRFQLTWSFFPQWPSDCCIALHPLHCKCTEVFIVRASQAYVQQASQWAWPGPFVPSLQAGTPWGWVQETLERGCHGTHGRRTLRGPFWLHANEDAPVALLQDEVGHQRFPSAASSASLSEWRWTTEEAEDRLGVLDPSDPWMPAVGAWVGSSRCCWRRSRAASEERLRMDQCWIPRTHLEISEEVTWSNWLMAWLTQVQIDGYPDWFDLT